MIIKLKLIRVIRRQRSLPERGHPIWKQSINIKDEMQNLNIAVNDSLPLGSCDEIWKLYLTCWIP